MQAYYYVDDDDNRLLIGTLKESEEIEFCRQEHLCTHNRSTWYAFLRQQEVKRFFLIDEPYCIVDQNGK